MWRIVTSFLPTLHLLLGYIFVSADQSRIEYRLLSSAAQQTGIYC
jgi:hypothetical protein